MILEQWSGAWYDDVDLSWRLEVSTTGKIRNAITKREYKLHAGASDYLQICTSINGKNKNIRVHRCVAETFLPNLFGCEIVNHIDGNKHNNNVKNLEWCSRRYNYAHAVAMNLIDKDATFEFELNSRLGEYHGSNNGMSKLTESDVIYIRDHYIPKSKGQKCNRRELAQYFGVSVGLISQIVKNKIWTHI